ncbi:hypothetical protein Leryth_013438 [Lithospermum erythrorhizon]|nr:hypothetical protein Leryth_013438 [Lithospermum erythrorhizon]
MESTFLTTNAAASLFPIANTLKPTSRTQLVTHLNYHFGSVSLSRSMGAVEFRKPVKSRIECLSSSPVPLESAGGGFVGKDGDGGSGGGGGGGDGAAEGGEMNLSGGAPVVDDVSALSSDVIILEVGGMTCGGCAASVKRILESQPQVSSAIVDLTTEVATVWPATDAKDGPNWQVQLGEALANHLTNCGFKSKLKGQLIS